MTRQDKVALWTLGVWFLAIVVCPAVLNYFKPIVDTFTGIIISLMAYMGFILGFVHGAHLPSEHETHEVTQCPH